MQHIGDLRATALDLYERASLDPECEFGALRVALALPQIDVVRESLFGPHAVTFRRRERFVVCVERALGRNAAEFACGHELGHHALARPHCDDPALERACDLLAAEIVAPAPAMYRLRMLHGFRLDALARDLGTTQTIAALRWGEVFDEPVAVVMPGRVLRRGPIAATDSDLRRIAIRGGCEGVDVVSLGDSSGRHVVRVRI